MLPATSKYIILPQSHKKVLLHEIIPNNTLLIAISQ